MHNDDYNVGYGKPPKASQFKKGQSGNPKGRPKDQNKDFVDSLKSYLQQKRKVKTANGEISMQNSEIMAHKLVEKALSPDLRAMTLLIKIMETHNISNQVDVILPYIPSRQELARAWDEEEAQKG
jgi:hypothetical protein